MPLMHDQRPQPPTPIKHSFRFATGLLSILGAIAAPATATEQSRAGDHHPAFYTEPVPTVYRSPDWDKEDLTLKAVKLALDGKHIAAQEIKSELEDGAARTLIDWLWITGKNSTGFVPFIHSFMRENPTWPNMRRIRARVEHAMYSQKTSKADVLWYFKQFQPVTEYGQYLYASALKESDPEKARKLVEKCYREHKRGPDFSAKIARRFPGWISDEDKFARLSSLIVRHKTTQAKKTAATMGAPFTSVALAAHKLLTQAKDAKKAKAALPLRYRYQPALQYALMRYYLRQATKRVTIRKGKKKRRVTKYDLKKVQAAMKAVLRASLGHKALPEAERWWKERQAFIHKALSSRKPAIDDQTSYELAANHGLTAGKHLPDAEWLAGWIAFRRLDKKELAASHFKRSRETSIYTRDKSRGYYWHARVLEALGEPHRALEQDRHAAAYGFTFYGLLGAAKSGGFANGRMVPPSGYRSIQAVMQAHGTGRLRALRLLEKAGAKRQVVQFALELARGARTANELAVTMDVVKSISGLPLAMKVARWGAWGGVHSGSVAYPTDPLPEFKEIPDKETERALVLAITRQESEFDSKAKSRVGARGFMQIMPTTGRWLCKIYKIKCSTADLVNKPELNVKLGSAFLHMLIKQWKGSYIMAAAGYNAGSSRVEKWNKIVGDPRKDEISPVDWIELIPFNETRNYVKRVMRNVQIYRRILEPQNKISMQDDLDRGRIRPLKTTQTETCDANGKPVKGVARCVKQD